MRTRSQVTALTLTVTLTLGAVFLGWSRTGSAKVVPPMTTARGTSIYSMPKTSDIQPTPSRTYTETVLYRFLGASNSVHPLAGLIADETGALYGTTYQGGASNNGMVFKLTPFETPSGRRYAESVLYSFLGGSDGAFPYAGVIADKTGALYGTTTGVTSSCGTVFKLMPSSTASGRRYTESVLYRFQCGSDGSSPYAGLIAGDDGALYGTTIAGGAGPGCYTGCGTVFKLTPFKTASGIGYIESVIYNFNLSGGRDGAAPYAGLMADGKGALYGTTLMGGTSGNGTVFKLTRSGGGYIETVIHDFQGSPVDGASPFAGLIVDKTGALYGTTASGGIGGCGPFLCGTVFKLTPSGSGYTESIVHSFLGGDGRYPYAGLIVDKIDALYGTTRQGGSTDNGTVYKLTPSGSGYTESVLYSFLGGSNGADLLGGLVFDENGALYGTTGYGGVSNNGTVFKLTPVSPSIFEPRSR
jgi:uncharacterized repeat protein (TIGR03803 family)